MRRYAHRQRHGALRAAGARSLQRPLHRGRVPGDHYLAGGIVVDRLDHAVARGLTTQREHRFVVQPEDRGHGAAAFGHRRLHRRAAKAHQLHRRGEVERAGAHQRGELPEAVAGHHWPVAPHPLRAMPRRPHRRLSACRVAC